MNDAFNRASDFLLRGSPFIGIAGGVLALYGIAVVATGDAVVFVYALPLVAVPALLCIARLVQRGFLPLGLEHLVLTFLIIELVAGTYIVASRGLGLLPPTTSEAPIQVAGPRP